MITCFSYSNNKNVYNISFPVLQNYCNKHKYTFVPCHTNLETNYKPHWNKIHYCIKMLRENKSDYFVWFDHDIIIKNNKIKIEDIIQDYKFAKQEALFMMSADPASNYKFNTGVIVFKNKPETLAIFEKMIEMRNEPKKYPLLQKYGGFNFNGGMQDTRTFLVYFEENKNMLLSIPHKILQSFYGQAEFYSFGDFCGHVAGPQGSLLIEKLTELNNLYNFDIVIPVGPNDVKVIDKQIEYTKKNVIGYRNIFLVTHDPNLNINGCITIDESIYPFNKSLVEQIHGKNDRNGWYLQQLLKLYAGLVIPNIMEKYLVIDSDTFFLKPTTFIENGKCLYNHGHEEHIYYFQHMKRLHPDLYRVHPDKSGICHHMMFETKYIKELFKLIEDKHNDIFYNVFLKQVHTNESESGASEYEIYFNYINKFKQNDIVIRHLKWCNSSGIQKNSPYQYVSCHHYMR
jgi:hypothetical protein